MNRLAAATAAVVIAVIAIAPMVGAFTASEKATIKALRQRITALEDRVSALEAPSGITTSFTGAADIVWTVRPCAPLVDDPGVRSCYRRIRLQAVPGETHDLTVEVRQ